MEGLRLGGTFAGVNVWMDVMMRCVMTGCIHWRLGLVIGIYRRMFYCRTQRPAQESFRLDGSAGFDLGFPPMDTVHLG